MQDSVDNTGISLKRISNEKEMRAWNVDQMARDLWGRDVPRRYPVYIVFYERKPVGFFLAVQTHVVYPALHPERISPRVFLKLTRSLVTEFKRMTGDPIFMLCDKSQAFGPKNLKRIRLKPAPENAFIYDEEAK